VTAQDRFTLLIFILGVFAAVLGYGIRQLFLTLGKLSDAIDNLTERVARMEGPPPRPRRWWR
jgi:hypothetical protein